MGGSPEWLCRLEISLSLFLPSLFDFLFFLSSLLAEHLGWFVCEVFKGSLWGSASVLGPRRFCCSLFSWVLPWGLHIWEEFPDVQIPLVGLFHPGSTVRQTSRAPEFPDDRPGGQAVTHSGLQGFSHFVFVTNRRWWWHYCSPWQLWALNDTVEMERAKETRRCLRLPYCRCVLYPGFQKSVYSWWWQSQVSSR